MPRIIWIPSTCTAATRTYASNTSLVVTNPLPLKPHLTNAIRNNFSDEFRTLPCHFSVPPPDARVAVRCYNTRDALTTHLHDALLRVARRSLQRGPDEITLIRENEEFRAFFHP